MVRLFAGLAIPREILPDIEAARGGVESAHWQRDDQLHLTLAFIGEVPRKTAREVEDALAGIYFDPFDLALQGVGVFGKPGQPKTLWLGVENRNPLIFLHEKIVNALDRIDVETERRKFKPHVTVARFRRRASARIGDWLTNNEVLHSRATSIDHFTLFSSERTSEGSFYRVESEIYAAGHCNAEDYENWDSPDWHHGLTA